MPDVLAPAAHRRMPYTGEPYQRALTALRNLAPNAAPIPAATAAQARLELLFLQAIGRYGVTEDAGWRPGEEPFGLTWITPRPEYLVAEVRRRFLPGIIKTILPHLTSGHVTVHGICGLRFRFTPRGVELFQLGLPGMIRLAGIRPDRWWQALAVGIRLDSRDPYLGPWLTHPDRLHPEEEAFLSQELEEPGLARVGSSLLRRHLIFRSGPPHAGIQLWLDGGINVEFAAGPTHQFYLDALLDPVFGLATTQSGPCTCAEDRCATWITLHPTDSHDDYIGLGRNPRLRWSHSDDLSSRAAFRKRISALKKHADAGPPAAYAQHQKVGS